MTLTADDFAAFFDAIHNEADTPSEQRKSPFPWQTMLVKRVLSEGWPEGIDLPTASGKTACLDIAVFTLACRVAQLQDPGTAIDLPRRTFFVVDRRIVVDEAHKRAEKIAKILRTSQAPVVREVAACLRRLAGEGEIDTGETLVVSRMRGGTKREDDWLKNPACASIITSTVDQVGSRMLFRGYGVSPLTAPIHAALTACDSLVLLDEAHCAVPFMQTVNQIRHYGGEGWREQGIVEPVKLSILSATLPEAAQDRFPEADKRQAALDHPILRRRITVDKPADLAVAKSPANSKWSLGEKRSKDALVLDAAQRAHDMVRQGRKRIAIMVNRIATASAIAEQLQVEDKSGKRLFESEVVLLTGRMRPLDRDDLIGGWTRYLRADAPEAFAIDGQPRAITVVTTQCLEVGADFSFDALITECASLDALRQRFGRLNRLGEPLSVSAAVLIRKSDVKPDSQIRDTSPLDPIYGNAMTRTWNWLNDIADSGTVNFGIEAMEQSLTTQTIPFEKLNAPSDDAPVMMPAYIDSWCQTAPRPSPDPDVSLFLHGVDRGLPETRVVFRKDLDEGDAAHTWLDRVSLIPPVSAEALSLPLPVLRRWLLDEPAAEAESDLGDVEGQSYADDRLQQSQFRSEPHRFLLWRGRRQSEVSRDPRQIRPGDTVVVSATDVVWAQALGHHFNRPPDCALDLAERAWLEARKQHVLRVSDALLAAWHGTPAIANLLDWLALDEGQEPADRDLSVLPRLLGAIAESDHESPNDIALPDWLITNAAELATNPQVKPVGDEAIVVMLARRDEHEQEFADDDDSTSASAAPLTVAGHCEDVGNATLYFAKGILSETLIEDLTLSGRLHDIGKIDPRFQAVLRAQPFVPTSAIPWAKSHRLSRSKTQREQDRRRAGLPERFRHEMLSLQIAEASAPLPSDPLRQALVLHLIAAHHGHARPLAPVCVDPWSEAATDPHGTPPDLSIDVMDMTLDLSGETRRTLTPAHRLDSRVADRFWQLTRHFGWWGLAYLETMLRLADWHASANPSQKTSYTSAAA